MNVNPIQDGGQKGSPLPVFAPPPLPPSLSSPEKAHPE